MGTEDSRGIEGNREDIVDDEWPSAMATVWLSGSEGGGSRTT